MLNWLWLHKTIISHHRNIQNLMKYIFISHPSNQWFILNIEAVASVEPKSTIRIHRNSKRERDRESKSDTFSCVQEKYPNHIRISYRQYSPFLLPPTVWGQSSIFPHAVCYITFHILYLVFLCCCSKQTLLDRQPHRTMPVPTPSFANRPLTTAKKVTLSLNSSRSSNNHKSSRNKNMLFQSILL